MCLQREKVLGRAHRAFPTGDKQRHKPMLVCFDSPLLKPGAPLLSLPEVYQQFGRVCLRLRLIFRSPPQYRYQTGMVSVWKHRPVPWLHCRVSSKKTRPPPKGLGRFESVHFQRSLSGIFSGVNMLLELCPGDRCQGDEHCCSFPGLAWALNKFLVTD